LTFFKKSQTDKDIPFAMFLDQCQLVPCMSTEALARDTLHANATYHSHVNEVPFVIDHILCKGFTVCKSSYMSWHDYVSINNGSDHTPVVCRVNWLGSSVSEAFRRRLVPYDRSKIGNGDCDALCLNNVLTCVRPSRFRLILPPTCG